MKEKSFSTRCKSEDESSQRTWLLAGFGAIRRFPLGNWRPEPGVNVLPQDTSEQSIRANRIQESFVFILLKTITYKRGLLITEEIRKFVDVLVAKETAFYMFHFASAIKEASL